MSNKSKILISDKLKDILTKIEGKSIIAKMLLKPEFDSESLVDDHVDYISLSSTDRTKISYLTNDRKNLLSEDEYWSSSRRFQAKPGGFLSKVFNYNVLNISGKEVEQFSNNLLSEIQKDLYEFRIVDGDEIKRYYHEDEYNRDRSSLGSSCMKHYQCQKYFKLYTKNQEVISLLIMINKDTNLISGRSLLWNFNGKKVMDRIYTDDDDKLSILFKDWAVENSYYYKSEQKWSNSLLFDSKKSKRKVKKFKVVLKRTEFDFYPYMDTFKFLDTKNNTLYNYIPKGKEGKIITLCSAEGDNCYGDYLKLDDLDHNYYYHGDIKYLEYLKMNVNDDKLSYSEINDTYILSRDCEYDYVVKDYVFVGEYSGLNNQERYNERKEYYNPTLVDSVNIVDDVTNTERTFYNYLWSLV